MTRGSKREGRIWLGVSVLGCAITFAAGALAVGSVFRAMIVIGGTIALGVIALTAWRPVWGVYLYLATLPFLAGIDRGYLLPLVRGNEGILVLVLLGTGLGGYLRLLTGERPRWSSHPLHAPLYGFLLASTIWPLAWMALRGTLPGGGDVSAVLPVAKLVALFVLVRLAVTTPDQVMRCLRVVVWGAAALGVIALGQTLKVGPVLSVLATYWSSGITGAERGTATLASSIATGDYVVVGLLVLLFGAVRGLFRRRETVALAVPLVLGVLAAGQFSTWLAVALGLVLGAWRSTVLRAWLIRALPLVCVAGLVVGSPAMAARFQEIGGDGPAGGSAMPASWVVRIDNLATFYLPRLDGLGFVFGVEPSSVLVPPETWRDVIYLESGYLQLLWVGGLPLLVTFAWLTIAVLRSARVAEDDPGPRGAAASALWIAWVLILVLTILDAHLTLRGMGDLVFTLCALVVGEADEAARTREPRTVPVGGDGRSNRRCPPGLDGPGPPGGTTPPDRRPDQVDQPGPGRVPAATGGEGSAPFHDVQVPDHAGGGRRQGST
ncbi:hypothetical protein GCM10023203_10550 [Actinomycetospora straminea]|uniref:O-antigen ligase n=1 Tax=Actinomycetospora straminea TaxID=663607 RepID=A0ABP9E062_9PSEU